MSAKGASSNGRWRWPLRLLVVLLTVLNLHYARRAREILDGLELQGVRPLVVRAADSDPAALALSIPERALAERVGQPVVFEVRGERIWVRPVVLGAKCDGRVVVRAGLVGDETLVADPPAGLREGDRAWLKP